MPTTATVRAELARHQITQRSVSAALQIPTDVLSQILNDHREDPTRLAQVWEYIQTRVTNEAARRKGAK